MRTVVVALALLGAAGGAHGEPAIQDEPALVFQRICNIERGQDDAAAELARDWEELVRGSFPGAEMTVTTGRWMTGFQNIERPFNQILIRERHLDAEMRQDFTDLLMADEGFRALQRKMLDVVDFGTCTESQFRERP